LTRSEALEQLLDQYANSPGVALVKYYNGFTKLFGTKDDLKYDSIYRDYKRYKKKEERTKNLKLS